MQRICWPTLLAATLVAGTVAHASSLETVVVTATRAPEPIAATGESISVITAKQLENLQVVTLSNALSRLPGTTVVRDGGLGQVTTLSLRGAEAGQTLMLIDGVRINDPSTVDGEALLGDLLVNNISRVEVLRGPQSALYGSAAIGGVVDIFTRRGGPAPLRYTLSAQTGSFATYQLAANGYGHVGAFDYGAGIQYLQTNGISAADARYGNKEPDGTHNLSATINTRYHLTPNLSLDLRGYAISARTQFDDNYAPVTFRVADSPVYNRDTLLVGYAGLNWALWQGHLKNRFAVTETASRRTTFDSPFYLPLHEDYAYRGRIERFSYQGTAKLTDASQLVFGAVDERTTLVSEIAGFADASGQQSTQGYYVEGLSQVMRGLTLSAGVRLENNTLYGTHTSYKATAAYTPNGGQTVLHANYATGFKAPSLYEQFSVYSNPLGPLSPEDAHGWEAGIDQNLFAHRILASLTWFDRTTHNLIDFFSCYGVTSQSCSLRSNAGGYYYNIGRAEASGVEAGVKGRISSAVNVRINYTYLNAIDLLTHTELARRPHNEANLILSWRPTDLWYLAGSVHMVGPRFDSANDVHHLGGYATADLFIARRISAHLKLYGRITNVLDHHYEPAYGYGAPGRAFYAGIRWNG